MFAVVRPAALATCLLALTAISVAAQTLPQPTTGHGRTKPTKVPKRGNATAPSGNPAANLNAPSTDFSNVEVDTGEPPSARQSGPNVRPSLDGNGRPVMGLGF